MNLEAKRLFNWVKHNSNGIGLNSLWLRYNSRTRNVILRDIEIHLRLNLIAGTRLYSPCGEIHLLNFFYYSNIWFSVRKISICMHIRFLYHSTYNCSGSTLAFKRQSDGYFTLYIDTTVSIWLLVYFLRFSVFYNNVKNINIRKKQIL